LKRAQVEDKIGHLGTIERDGFIRFARSYQKREVLLNCIVSHFAGSLKIFKRLGISRRSKLDEGGLFTYARTLLLVTLEIGHNQKKNLPIN